MRREVPSKARRLAPAIADALAQEMRRDPRVILWGEDVTVGVMSVTSGLATEFGPGRVRDTPISEAGFLGGAIGAAMGGLRPIVEIMYGSFTYVAFDQLVNQAGRLRYMSGGETAVPMVILVAMGAALSLAAQHSEATYALYLHGSGLRVVFPSTPNQAFWLTRAAIRSDDPVIVVHHPALAATRGAVVMSPLRLGSADVFPPGSDVTVVACGMMAHRARRVAERLGGEVSVEVVDLCSLNPLPWDAVLASAEKTRRVLVVDEARKTCSIASEISATVSEELFGRLATPVRRLAVADVPIPFAPVLEAAVIPDEDDIEQAVRELARG